MHYRSLIPSKYLAAADLDGQQVEVVIENIQIEEVGMDKDECPVMYFEGVKKGLCLNVTNLETIAEWHGEQAEEWVGKTITLYATKTDFKGKRVPCIRVVEKLPDKKTTFKKASQSGDAKESLTSAPTATGEEQKQDQEMKQRSSIFGNRATR
jgi:hypothetical protein